MDVQLQNDEIGNMDFLDFLKKEDIQKTKS